MPSRPGAGRRADHKVCPGGLVRQAGGPQRSAQQAWCRQAGGPQGCPAGHSGAGRGGRATRSAQQAWGAGGGGAVCQAGCSRRAGHKGLAQQACEAGGGHTRVCPAGLGSGRRVGPQGAQAGCWQAWCRARRAGHKVLAQAGLVGRQGGRGHKGLPKQWPLVPRQAGPGHTVLPSKAWCRPLPGLAGHKVCPSRPGSEAGGLAQGLPKQAWLAGGRRSGHGLQGLPSRPGAGRRAGHKVCQAGLVQYSDKYQNLAVNVANTAVGRRYTLE
ncbi:paraneoplastic antigen Ma6E-like [Macrobrachium nipponense]|uniref:paraneoplastic antigen Ma6E-like n=1 Tax=Macrobrachium nipponense TaxID=159736 RepID=UPI0030C841F7